MGASMFAQSKLGGSPTGGPSSTTPPGFQTMLPIVFTVLFYRMPSGLVIYWIINTVLSVAQQYYIHREPKSELDDSNATTRKGGLKSKGR
jgi:YidC/Oxa1 family membrane protein insertase